MTETQLDVADYTLPFVTAMKARNISAANIARFLRHWRGQPRCASHLPCPYCFVRKVEGALVPVAENRYGLESVQCLECGGEIVVRLSSMPMRAGQRDATATDGWPLF